MRFVRIAIVALIVGGFSLIVGPADAGGGCHGGQFSDAAGTTVDIRANCFLPRVLRVGQGATVTWTNHDSVAHTVTGAGNPAIFGNSQDLPSKESVSHRFDEPGVYPYFCYYHPSMIGSVVVGDGNFAGSVDQVATLAKTQSDRTADGTAVLGQTRESASGVSSTAAMLIAIAAMSVGFLAGRIRLRNRGG